MHDRMDLISDLELSCLIDEADYNHIISIYSDSENKSLDRALKLKNIIKRSESDDIKVLMRLLGLITDAATEARDYDESLAELDNTIVKLSESNPEAAKGWNRLKSIIPKLDGYFLSKKIEKIKDRYSRVSSFQITTDVRPIFDIKRESIESNIYPYILKIDTSDDKTFLCEFYDDSLDEFIKELQRAKSKADAIREKYDGC